MKYNLPAFNIDVKYYQEKLKQFKENEFLFVFEVGDVKAYYSIAPLSRAVHNLNKDIHVIVRKKASPVYNILKEIWQSYENIKKGRIGKKEAALRGFIEFVDTRGKGKFRRLFEKPVVFEAKNNRFVSERLSLDIKANWFKPYRWNELITTSKVIWNQVFDVAKKESVSVRFETIPREKDIEKPLEDYLDSYLIARAMYETVKGRCKSVVLGTATSRMSVLAQSEYVGDLKQTLIGCELEKNIAEPVFKKFLAVSKLFRTNRITIASAAFSINGKGYGGKHLFGELFGYPTLNRKSKWTNPGSMLYKFNWSPQAIHESRPPKSRIGFTQTIPIDDFILTCNIDWLQMEKRDQKLVDIINRCEKVVVKGKMLGKFRTDFVVYLVDRKGNRRMPKKSDVEIRYRTDLSYFKKTGILCGTMCNIPGGEMFLTPESIDGTVAGDVVIAIDESYRLSGKDPLVLSFSGGNYKVVRGPKKVLAILNKKRKESWKKILIEEKNRSVPKVITDMKKKNFNRVGEFAINTNPRAKLSGYLIVDEKIAGMIHVAIGSGFDPDRATEYHNDIVINCKEQKMDIYGVTKSGKEIWIIRKGKFVV